MRYYLLTILALMTFGVPAVSSRYSAEVGFIAKFFSDTTNQIATVVLSHNPKTVDAIRSKYDNQVLAMSFVNDKAVPSSFNKIRVLIVPGHEPTFGGAEYRDLKERDMTLELGNDLKAYLDSDSHYQTFITRDDNGWTSIFADYFKNDWSGIVAWEKASAADMAHRIAIGSSTKPVSTVYHNKAPDAVAYRLYGITKWANENDIDITIHIHFNDDTEHRMDKPGVHSGFAIYIPEHQYENSSTSKAVAEAIFSRLARYNPVSDLKGESAGIVEDPDLIAIGAHDTANAASMLIEYGYIYEPQFQDAKSREEAIKNLAYQTYLGLQDFFNNKADSSQSLI